MTQFRIDSIEKRNCTGCKMCGDLCPSDAISFEDDSQGFWYPVIDETKCIHCGVCFDRCPSTGEWKNNENMYPIVYSLWSNNSDVRRSSTSGGGFWEFAAYYIRTGGIVVGSEFNSDWRSARHAVATTIQELERLKGSKYFQSDTNGIYNTIKKYLNEGKDVLFCGTPCQNAALSSFLNKHYDNLILIDFICRSINSPKAFKAYIDGLEKEYCSKVTEVQLKNKDRGWQSLASKVFFENGDISLRDKNDDPWVKGFIVNDLYTRESCFDCKYRQIPRNASDLTIGDFWGIRNQKTEDMFNGISVLLVNSEKGANLFEKVKDRFTYSEHSFEEVIPGNPSLRDNPTKTSKQDAFFELINNGEDFSDAVVKCSKDVRSKEKVRNRLWRIIKRFKKLFIDDTISLPKYIYYNYFCKHIDRQGGAKILPHTKAILNFEKGSKIILSGGNLEIGFNKLKGSKSETHIRLNKNAIWYCKNGGLLFYNTILEIKQNASFESGFFSANGGSVIVVHKKIIFGEDVMIGRNVIIYDSDFHSIYDKHRIASNVPQTVVIEDHVWLTTNIMVQKGVKIGRDSLIAAYTVVNKDVPPHSIWGGKANGELIKDWVCWNRKMCPDE